MNSKPGCLIRVDRYRELVGNFANKGTDDRPEGQPRRCEVHDVEKPQLGKVVPYGVDDVADNSTGSSATSPRPGGPPR